MIEGVSRRVFLSHAFQQYPDQSWPAGRGVAKPVWWGKPDECKNSDDHEVVLPGASVEGPEESVPNSAGRQ